MAEAALKLSGVSKTYKRPRLGRPALLRGVDSVSLEVARGEVFGLLGLNGSGKTTVIKILLGLLFPTSGRCEVLGHQAAHPDALKRIGYLPEIPSFNRNLSPVELLSLYGAVSGIPSATLGSHVDGVLEQLKLSAHKTKRIRELSKGMLQRLGLAQAILHKPDLLILDEPVTGLDPLGIRQTRELMAELARSGTTIFFSSHSISELERLSTRVGILVGGKLARLICREEWQGESGKLEELFLDALRAEGEAI